ncbi:methyltransferase [Streptosporangium soli]|nr:methyltransferase domain-containing protein [Streptosporangium sp. KLBMP 9127]
MTTVTPATRQDIVAMMQAYRQTSLLRAGVELGVFDGIASGAHTAADLAERLNTDPRALRILLNALAAIGLLKADGRRFDLPADVRRHLVQDSPGYLGQMVRIFASDWEWDALKVLADAVRRGGAVVDVHAETPNFSYWEDFATHATPATGPTAALIADVLAPWMSARNGVELLDVACGHGLYGYTIAQKEPRIRVNSLDWANVLPIAERNAEKMGVRDQCSFIEGDMFTTPLGGPYDLALVTNVLHHFSAQRAAELLGRVHESLAPDGKLVIVGFVIGDQPPAQDPPPYLFSVLMLSWTSDGEVHSEQEYTEMLGKSGFVDPVFHALPGLPLHVIIADRASR